MSKLVKFIRNSSLVTEESTPREIRRLVKRHKRFAKDIDFGPIKHHLDFVVSRRKWRMRPSQIMIRQKI